MKLQDAQNWHSIRDRAGVTPSPRTIPPVVKEGVEEVEAEVDLEVGRHTAVSVISLTLPIPLAG